MARTLFILFALASALLCLALAGVGIRSFYRVEKFQYVWDGGTGMMVIPKKGRLDMLYFKAAGQDPGFLRIRGSPHSIGGTDYGRRVLGFGAGVSPAGGRYVNLPFWALALACAAPPALLVRTQLRRRRTRPGLCPACGYDLRGTPTQCPECGTSAGDVPA
jgi:hypothetical protein